MKYPNWDGYTDEQKDKAVAEELRLETHNGTTKDDLLNIIRYLAAKVKEAGTMRKWIVFYDSKGKELAAYTEAETFAGEQEGDH